MTEDAERLRRERDAAAHAQADADREERARRWDIINAAVREFVEVVTKGVKPKKLFKPSWTVYIGTPPRRALDSYIKLVIKSDGSWEITQWTDRDLSNNKPKVIAGSHSEEFSLVYLTNAVVDEVRPRLVEKLSELG